MKKISTCITALLIIPYLSFGQKSEEEAAEKFSPANLASRMGTTGVIPFFLAGSHKFWFLETLPAQDQKSNVVSLSSPTIKSSNENPSFKKKSVFYLVDPDKRKKEPLFDEELIQKKLSILLSKDVQKGQIRYRPDFSADQKTVIVNYLGVNYDYNYREKSLAKRGPQLEKSVTVNLTGTQSPDHQWIIYARNHNLYLKKISDSVELTLSIDGEKGYSFSINPEDSYSSINSVTNVHWTADSKSFYLLRKDTRKVKTLTVINSLTTPRPGVNTYPYELPGDKDVMQYEVFVGNTENKKLRKINTSKWIDQEVLITDAEGSSKEMFFIRKKRSRDEMELCAVNLADDSVRVLIHEQSKPFINDDLFNVSIVNQGNDILWWSDRTGWGQYYHYNRQGKFLNAITSGNWTAGKIIGIDSLGKKLIFYGYGREKGINPNYAFVYKTDFSGGKLDLLTPENATHAIFLSKDRRYFVDNFSRIDLEPRAVVRSITTGASFEIMKSDMSQLYAYGWKQPEEFIVKAKDGVTNLYGLMWKPFNFDANKRYPIISQVYPGPQTETVWSEFTVLDRYNNTQLAQMGFIVVVMGHRGGTPVREAKYYKYGYGNLRDYALEDDKYGLEQLAYNYGFIDLNQVGVFGHSGGGMMSTAALCTYPEFYKVGVSSSANHDNTIYNRTWGETYQGFGKPIDLNQSIAKGLKGHLLLVSGESDANVHPAGTMRMADALIKAGKKFDMLILPGQSHTYDETYKIYFQKRLREYFMKYLCN